jgi:predicted Fe-S protein YdhL (DUF1289 family)
MTGPAESPCRQICRLGNDKVCDGCGRTIQEIAAWYRLDPADRGTINRRVADWTIRGVQPSGQDQPRSW